MTCSGAEMPDSPLLAVYVLGAYGFGAFIMAGIVLRPFVFDRLARSCGMSRQVFTAAALAVWTLLWPIALCALLALLIAERRGGGDG